MAIGTRKSAVKTPTKIEAPVAPPAPVKPAPTPKPVVAKANPPAKAAVVAAPVAPAPVVAPIAAKPVKAKAAPKPVAPKPAAPVVAAPIVETPAEFVVKPVEAPVVPTPKVSAAAVVAPVPAASKPTPIKPVAVVETLIAAVKAPSHEEISAFGKANVEAIVHANKVLAQGVEAISREVVSATQASFGAAQAAAKALLGAKTLADVMELNAKFTKASFDRFVGDTTRIGELGAKLAQETLAPLATRVTHVVERVTHR